MTDVLITIDTELSPAAHRAGMPWRENFASAILGRCPAGDFGIGRQMDLLDAHGLKGVFFVDPLPALAYGPDVVTMIVAPIVARGHEVQLHIHSEWLEFAREDPVAGRRGQNIGDFSLGDQTRLLAIARDLLVAAGAPAPIAFRAGNYGADDRSLAALATLGLRYDSSFNPAYLGNPCRISLPASQIGMIAHHGMIEVPVSAIFALPGRLRHAQLCALSAGEMRAALRHTAEMEQPAFTIVSHSFELLSRDRLRPNHAVIARFAALCAAVAGDARLRSSGFCDLVATPEGGIQERLPPSRLRTGRRMAEQALAQWRFERGR